MHQSSPATITITELDDVTAPVVTPTGCSGVVTIASSLSQGTWSSGAMGGLSGTITLLALAGGTCTLQIADGNGQSATLSLIGYASGTVREFSATPLSANVVSLTSGGDGNLYAIESNKKLAKITMAGALTELALALTQSPIDIAYGSDGDLWILEGSTTSPTTTLAKVSTSGTLVTELNLPFSGTPTAIAAGGDGNFYLPECDTPSSGGHAPAFNSQMAKVTISGTVSEHTMFAYTGGNAPGCYGPSPWGTGGVTPTSTGAAGMTIIAVTQDWYGDGGSETYPFAVETATGSTNAFAFSDNVNGGWLAFGASNATTVTAPGAWRNITTDSSGNTWVVFNAESLGGCDSCVVGQGAWLSNGSGGVGISLLQPTFSVVGDANGYLWLGQGTHITRYQVSSRGVTTYSQGITSAQVMVVGPDGNLWYAGNTTFGYISP